MLCKRLVVVLTFHDGILFRTKKFRPDLRYTLNFVDLDHADQIALIHVSGEFSNFVSTVRRFRRGCRIPLLVGGGIASLDNAIALMDIGADSVLIGAKRVQTVREVAGAFGSANVCVGVDNGRCDPVSTALEAQKHGAGEILLQDVSRDGSLSGLATTTIRNVSAAVTCPVIATSGVGSWKHFYEGYKAGADAVGTQCIYHFTARSLIAAKRYLDDRGISVRI